MAGKTYPLTAASTVESYESRTHMGGARPPSGSTAAVAQSSVDKHANFVAAAQETAAKIQTDPTSVTAADANHLESLEAHDMGSARPRKDSISAEAKRVASANEGHRSVSAAITKGPDPVHAAQVAREKEYAEAIAVIQPKMVNDPKSVTQEDAALLQSSEVRARGQVEKGGIASQALHLAAANQSGEKGR